MIYPVLSVALLVFAVSAIIFSLFFGFIFTKLLANYSVNSKKIFNLKYAMLINGFLWLINFIYSGVPLLNLLLGRDFNHLISFGIPTVIVFIISFNGFLCLLTFFYYLKTKNKKYLLYFLINNLFFVLIFSRGSVMLSILGSFFIWLFLQNKAVSIFKMVIIAVSALLILYIFGVAGNYRTIGEIKNNTGYEAEYSSEIILKIADVSPSFTENIIPDEFMWSYVYLTSPIGNLQENIDKANPDLSFKNVLAYVVNEFTFDFVSKRIQAIFNIPKYDLHMFTYELSVPTVFAEAYLYLGWYGIVIYLVAILAFPFLYFALIRKHPLWQIGVAVLCCIYFFSIFDNMFVFSGLSLQLFYPFLFFKKKRVLVS
jgi:oligosaccharide repeat unit polymerase